MFYCMFEQSGTFKNEFKNLGYEAIDLDIMNEFGATDRQLDLFQEIENGYDGKPSIFDSITTDDMIIAFFPCTRFEAYTPLLARAESNQLRNIGLEQKLEYSRRIFNEVNHMYQLWIKMWLICLRGGLRLVCENPCTQPHILTQFFPVKPSVIHKDRTLYGDYYKKPTQYWFLNCSPRNNFLFENLQSCCSDIKRIDAIAGSGKKRAIERSMISSKYANRFIREHIIDLYEERKDDN